MNLIISIFLILISVGAFFTYIDPTYQEIKDLRVIEKSYLEKQASASKIQEKKIELNKKYLDISDSDIRDIKKFLPDHINNIELIVEIHRIAKLNNIGNISDISLVKKDRSSGDDDGGKIDISEEGDYESVVLSFSFVSKYENFKRFLDHLKRNLRLVDISNISIRKQKVDKRKDKFGNEIVSKNDNFIFSLSIRTYWLKN